jgi:hypothetical protein
MQTVNPDGFDGVPGLVVQRSRVLFKDLTWREVK